MERGHAARVERIADRVRTLREAGETPRIVHGSTNSTRPQAERDDREVDIGDLDHVLDIDRDAMTVTVEPNVPMDALVAETLEHGLVPPVVMEFPGITVGGGIQGGAGESSSFRHGAFHDTCSRYELVLGSGEVVEAGPAENADLFHGTACSYGSLGILTEADLDLVPATRFVRLTYHPVDGMRETVERVREFADRDDIDFLDAIVFGPDRGVVMTGVRSDRDDLPVNRFRRARDDWFHRHARAAMERGPVTENVPLGDYLFRYDRGAFWTGELAFDHLPVGPSREARTLLDPLFRTRRMYRFLHAGNLSSRYIVQDLCMPEERAADFVDWLDRTLDIYPLWICPLEPDGRDASPLSPGEIDTDLIVNVGVWGDPAMEVGRAKRALEDAVLEMGGRKVLYAHQYYPEDEFWQMYDREGYEALRERYDAAGFFPDVYETTHVDHLPPASKAGMARELPRVLRDVLRGDA